MTQIKSDIFFKRYHFLSKLGENTPTSKQQGRSPNESERGITICPFEYSIFQGTENHVDTQV